MASLNSSVTSSMETTRNTPIEQTEAQVPERSQTPVQPQQQSIKTESLHPAGIVLNRPGHYTIPSMHEVTAHFKDDDGTCMVPHLTLHQYCALMLSFKFDILVVGFILFS